MNCYYFIIMRLGQRVQTATAVQETLTKFGCHIRTRLGMHDVGEGFCIDEGIVILQVCGDRENVENMLLALNAIDSVKAKLVSLDD
jgi:hypothetical protein